MLDVRLDYLTQMRYKLFHKDQSGLIHESNSNLSFLAFVKHATFAGINRAVFPSLPFRYVSIFSEFLPYFHNFNFQILSELANDPTEKAYISNKIGRAFADHLAKKIYGARFTHNYETAMILNGHNIQGERPDFYCDTLNQQFAIEAKGYSSASISNTAMDKHKNQSTMGPLPINFSVASVAFNLYKRPKVRFYDPIMSQTPYNDDLNKSLRDSYYKSILNFIKIFSSGREQSQIEDYIEYKLIFPSFISGILIHKAVEEGYWQDDDWLLSIKEQIEEKNLYIDIDGVGLTSNQRRTR